MTLYTIAFDRILLACIPDGGDIGQAVRVCAETANIDAPDDFAVYSGLTLTNERPEDKSKIIYEGDKLGNLIDEQGRSFRYAVAQ